MRLAVKFLAGAAATLVMSSAAALAADPAMVLPALVAPQAPPPPPPPNFFNGPYLGLILGHALGDKTWDTAGPLVEHPVTGFMFGAEAGYRFQTGNFAFGVEADIAWTNIDGASPCIPVTCSTDLDWLATITGQVGFAPRGGQFLLYGEGGVAFADENFTATTAPPFVGSIINSGWLVGLGAVYATNAGWYVKGEYNYINFGVDQVAITDGVTTETFDLTQAMHVLKIGVGFLF